MKVCTHNGILVAVLTRNEHCPPHVHATKAEWNARFTFSFWHNSVQLWDVTPAQNSPKASVLEALRQEIKQPDNLRNARSLWWSSHQTVCLENQNWNPIREEVVAPKMGPDTLPIVSSRFDPHAYRTFLQVAGVKQPLEIEL